ncbi:MAG: C40 family peptidase [Burkholderiaceae bacterium]|nr:C40 family peptidase [Burkholderiaceae bacterium]
MLLFRIDFRLRRRILGLLFVTLVLFTLSGCSIFRSHSIEGYAPVDYDGSKGSLVLKTAMTQVGTPYSYGKATPYKGFDCSGLIWWAYKEHGKKLPRHTSRQAKVGKSVRLGQSRQGDIVVFRFGKRLHTGLMADKNRFLHAPSSGGYVRLESIKKVYWKNRLVSIRRVFP